MRRGVVHNRTDSGAQCRDDDRVNTLKDTVGVLLLVALLPLWMAAALGFVALVVARHLYWWARGNTTAVSRGSGESTAPAPLLSR